MAVAMVNTTVLMVKVHESVETWSWRGILCAPHELKTSLILASKDLFLCVFSSSQDVTEHGITGNQQSNFRSQPEIIDVARGL